MKSVNNPVQLILTSKLGTYDAAKVVAELRPKLADRDAASPTPPEARM